MPLLGPADFARFDLEAAFELVRRGAQSVTAQTTRASSRLGLNWGNVSDERGIERQPLMAGGWTASTAPSLRRGTGAHRRGVGGDTL